MDLKNKIVEKAYELFSLKGYDKTSIENIISAVGCSKGGFYHHFNSKEDILVVVVDKYVMEIEKCLENKRDDSFINNFNRIYEIICQNKLGKLTKRNEITNLFGFHENDKIIMIMEQKSAKVIYDAYLKVINDGIRNKEIIVKNPEIVASLCTKHILWIFEKFNHYVGNKEKDSEVVDLVDIASDVIAYILNIDKSQLTITENSRDYLHKLNEAFFK